MQNNSFWIMTITMNNTTGATCGAGTANSSGAHEFNNGFYRTRDANPL